MIGTNTINLENKRTWISPTTSVDRKMAHYKILFTQYDGFIMRPSFLYIHLSYALCTVVGQLRISSYQLLIEVGNYARISLEERICQLCYQEWNLKSTMLVMVLFFMK